MLIVNSTMDDIPVMLQLYDIAREYQKENSLRSWLPFDPALLEEEINEKKHWKIIEDDTIVCIFLIAYDDPYIWGEKNSDPSIYIHRIVTNPLYRGNSYVLKIIEWAKEHAKEKGKQFIRMDTWGDNPKLINYYVKCGFNFLGIITPEATENLPKHYSCISLGLLEMKMDSLA